MHGRGYGDALWVAHVDANVRCIDLTSYEDSSAGLPIRAILTRAAELGSAGVVLAQRTPRSSSGEALYARPATAELARAAEAMDVSLLDHLIFAGADCTSMRRAGML